MNLLIFDAHALWKKKLPASSREKCCMNDESKSSPAMQKRGSDGERGALGTELEGSKFGAALVTYQGRILAVAGKFVPSAKPSVNTTSGSRMWGEKQVTE